MLAGLLVLLRSLALVCRGHRAVAFENLALRQQLAVFQRTVKRPPLRPSDRLFWVVLSHAWRNWRAALVIVQPGTVVRWHRQWLRRRWTRRSTHPRPGRPSTDTAIRTLSLPESRSCGIGVGDELLNARSLLKLVLAASLGATVV